ncbi:hypothetical protein PMG11_09173 [Penicillium brasilianum]|uniref:FAD-binding domain-containing protein n=1 Tax=Penicillium brasilianum TaxID=104259 RepID=A0A0F7TVC6_PENBI|nr:hypothetical protein PMG11_09173 [Penicillium brasilianum]
MDETFPLEIESVSYWTVAALNSERYSSENGRVFIAGDAAHVMPPTGGMGGNTGIQDAYNLAWKLAYVVDQKASPSLLKSYTIERQAAAEQIMQQAFARLVNRVLRDPSIVCDKELPDDTCELGYRYPRGAFISEKIPPTDPLSGAWEDPHSPSIRIGARLPHVALRDSSRPVAVLSTLDLLKRNFVLLVGGEFHSWERAAVAQSVQIDVHEISGDSSRFVDLSGGFKAIYQLGIDEALLIRPDGIVAWRGQVTEEQERSTLLRRSLGKILGF